MFPFDFHASFMPSWFGKCFKCCKLLPINTFSSSYSALCRNKCTPCSGWWTCANLARFVPGLASQWYTASPHADSQRASDLPQEHHQHQTWQKGIHRGWWHEGSLQHIDCEWEYDMRTSRSQDNSVARLIFSPLVLFLGVSSSADTGPSG